MLTVVTWKWTPPVGYRSKFPPETVNVLRRMVARHYPEPHRFVCVTDDPHGLDPEIETLPMWTDFADVPSPHGGKNPSCYRRLRAFAPDASEYFGARFVSLDLDTVITGDLSPLWNRTEDFLAWGDTNPRKPHYNCSMFMLRTGSRPQVWEQFDPVKSPRDSFSAGYWGSDQGWISYCLGPFEKKWTKDDGVYSYRNDLRYEPYKLPKDARVVAFHGAVDPWDREAQRLPWVRAHWC